MSLFSPWALIGRHGDSVAKRFGGAAVAESFEEKRFEVKARRTGVPIDLNGESPVVLKEDPKMLFVVVTSAL